MANDTHAPLVRDVVAEEGVEAYLAAVAAADPTVLVRKAVRQGLLDDWFESRERPKQLYVLALGKAAPRMVWGLVEASVPFQGLGVTVKGALAPNVDTFRWLTGDHPVAGSASLAAGAAVQAWIDALPREAPLLVLLSGGASAVAEVLAPHASLADAIDTWTRANGGGMDIAPLNERRAAISLLKAGRLGKRALERTSRIRVWLMCDTEPSTAARDVGSGPFHQAADPATIPHRVLATSDELATTAGLRLGLAGYAVYRHGRRIAGDAQAEATAFIEAFHGLPAGRVALVGAGEATVRVPAHAVPGGRCKHAALAAAAHLRGAERFVALASDGLDGTTDAGAWVGPGDADPDALAQGAAAPHLERLGRTVTTGPSGTNLNDLWIALRPA